MKKISVIYPFEAWKGWTSAQHPTPPFLRLIKTTCIHYQRKNPSSRGEKIRQTLGGVSPLPRFSFDRNLDNVLLIRHHGDQGLVTPFQGITPWQGSGFCWTEPRHPSRSRTRCYGNAKKNHESNLWCGYLSKFFWGRNGLAYVKHLWLEYLSLFCYPDKICFERYGQFPSHLHRYTYCLQLSLSYHVNRSKPLDHNVDVELKMFPGGPNHQGCRPPESDLLLRFDKLN